MYLRPKVIFFIYVLLVVVDAIGEALQYKTLIQFSRFVTPCMLPILYFLNTKKVNYVYFTSFIFMFIGLYNYNISIGHLKWYGLLVHALVLLLYLKIIFNVDSVSKDHARKLFPFLLLFVLTPLYFYLNFVDFEAYFPLLIYGTLLGLFLGISILRYARVKNNITILILTAAVSLYISSLLGGYRFYFKNLPLVAVLDVLFYAFGHYAMCCYVIKSDQHKMVLA